MLLINVKIVEFTMANSYNYFSRPISCETQCLAMFHISFSSDSLSGRWATFWGLAGHFWTAGHRLGTSGLYDVMKDKHLTLEL